MIVNEKQRGSAQVIEMSFVLPMAMGVVIALIYFAFAMFLYVHLQGIAEVAADRIEEAIVSSDSRNSGSFESKQFSDIYFLFYGEHLSEDENREIEAEFSERLDELCVLPGMNADFQFEVKNEGINPKITVQMECSCFGSALFTSSVERKVYFAKEFADNADLFLQVSDATGTISYITEKFGRLKEICDEFF